MSKSELACTYAALILHDDGLEITADNLNSILKVRGAPEKGVSKRGAMHAVAGGREGQLHCLHIPAAVARLH
eukprot:485463-Pelagomonas_calceolata.AAC.2